jgi:hypothetical protein
MNTFPINQVVAEVVFKSGTVKTFKSEAFEYDTSHPKIVIESGVEQMKQLISDAYKTDTRATIMVGEAIIAIHETAAIELYIAPTMG